MLERNSDFGAIAGNAHFFGFEFFILNKNHYEFSIRAVV